MCGIGIELEDLEAVSKELDGERYSNALNKMVHRIDEQYGKYYKKTLTNLSYKPITINKGRRFDKLVQDNSVYCFVEKQTGDVYKSATWKQPYTKGRNCVRGNIYDVSTYWDKELKYGSWLYA